MALKWTPELLQELRSLYLSGVPIYELARIFAKKANYGNYSEDSIRFHLKQSGVVFKPATIYWTPEKIAELRKMRAEGVTLKRCAEHFGRSQTLIHWVLRRAERRDG